MLYPTAKPIDANFFKLGGQGFKDPSKIAHADISPSFHWTKPLLAALVIMHRMRMQLYSAMSGVGAWSYLTAHGHLQLCGSGSS